MYSAKFMPPKAWNGVYQDKQALVSGGCKHCAIETYMYTYGP